jgi:hypothetical protein
MNTRKKMPLLGMATVIYIQTSQKIITSFTGAVSGTNF